MADAATKAPGVRARVRAELTAAIKASARHQLAEQGAAALSLRAIARQLEMSSSAIYRYFPSRDDLLTALIVDAYDALGVVVEAADAAVDRDDHVERFVAIARSIRLWAHDNPHEYALIYGSPVPGYAAPDDTIDPATRVPVALISVLVDALTEESAGGPENPVAAIAAGGTDQDKRLAASLAQLLDFVDHQVAPEVLARGVRAWAELFGMVSLELFGHFNNAVTDPGEFFEHAIVQLAERTLSP